MQMAYAAPEGLHFHDGPHLPEFSVGSNYSRLSICTTTLPMQ
jgi:hypothetical protein